MSTATLPAAACARSVVWEPHQHQQQPVWWRWHRISGPVSAQRKPPGTARRNNAGHRQRLAHLRYVTGAQDRETTALSAAARLRRTQPRGTARSPETRQQRPQTRITPISAAARTYGAARTAAAHTIGEHSHSNAGHRTGTVRRLRLAPVLTPDFGIVDDVAAVCQVT